MKRFSNIILIFCFVLLGTSKSSGQIALQYTDTTLCPGMPLVMCAALTGQGTDITDDDVYSATLDIGFDFVYFGKAYNKCLVSGNGLVTFDTTMAGMFGANWHWGQASTSGQANNAIFVAFFDMHPQPGNGKIRYQRFGQPGTRRFVVEWCDVGTYNTYTACGTLRTTTELVLYEGSNNIEMHTTQLPAMSFTGSCPGASIPGYTGQVVQGVRNETGLLQYFAPNRDPVVSATNWGVTGVVNDGMRFTPNGSTTYLSAPIPFDPWVIIDETSSPDLKWYAEGDPNLPIATGACATITANANINYYVVNFNGNAGCSPTPVNFYDTVNIHFGTSYDTTDVEICAGTTYSWFGRDLFKAGNYDTLLVTGMGCDSLLRLRLQVNPLPNVTLKGSPNVEICAESSTILALANPEAGVTYQWYKDNVAVAGETASEIVVTEAGKYKVEGTTGKGCKAMSDVFTLKVNPNPVANIVPPPDEIICAYDTLEIKAVPGASYDYRWTPEKPFRVITGAEGEKVKGVFIDPLTTVTLTVYNQYGCYDTATTIVQTKPCCEVFVPNAFSPNGDGLNEYFNPQLQLGQILLSMQVFDRYGKLIYNNTNIKKGWDGKYDDGAEAGNGVYMYYIKYTCADGNLYEKKESVSLIR